MKLRDAGGKHEVFVPNGSRADGFGEKKDYGD